VFVHSWELWLLTLVLLFVAVPVLSMSANWWLDRARIWSAGAQQLKDSAIRHVREGVLRFLGLKK
jgi:hypothetical protein